MTRLLLIRHGQSEWNADGRWQGQENPPLTALGRSQALTAAAAVGAVDGIYCSPLERAADTAQLISGEIGIGPVVVVPGLMERHAGEWQGLTRDQIEEQFPGYLDAGTRPPSWEDDDEVEQRVMSALRDIVDDAAGSTAGASTGSELDQSFERSEPHVLAVAHAGVIFAVERVFGAEWERLANLGGRWLEHRDGRFSLGERVHLLIDETIPDQI